MSHQDPINDAQAAMVQVRIAFREGAVTGTRAALAHQLLAAEELAAGLGISWDDVLQEAARIRAARAGKKSPILKPGLPS